MSASVEARKKTTLAIVCCHAIYEGSDPACEKNWRLQSFQRSAGLKPGEHLTFLHHIHTAVHLWEVQAVDAVVFSGGRTNAHSDASEARSYLDALNYKQEHAADAPILEEHATDSYQNLLFSILAFKKHRGYYPTDIVLITHAFKEQRFLELHAKSIRWPSDRIRVLGINPPFTQHELETTKALEHRHGYLPFSADLYGAGEMLSQKRQNRRWDPAISIPELANNLEDIVKQLLQWTGGQDGTEVFPHPLPWE